MSNKIIYEERVLDTGFMQLIDFMGGQDAVVDAARVSYEKLAEMFTLDQNDKLLRYLIAHHHTTPFEMIDFKFRIKAPVVVWWHWVRHRMASYNLQSGRYVEYSEECYVPKRWRLQSKSNKQGSSGLMDQVDSDKLSELLSQRMLQAYQDYELALNMGAPREQARFFLKGFTLYHEGIVKMNMRSLMNFINLRNADDAQGEIQEYAAAVERAMRFTHPDLMEIVRPCKS